MWFIAVVITGRRTKRARANCQACRAKRDQVQAWLADDRWC